MSRSLGQGQGHRSKKCVHDLFVGGLPAIERQSSNFYTLHYSYTLWPCLYRITTHLRDHCFEMWTPVSAYVSWSHFCSATHGNLSTLLQNSGIWAKKFAVSGPTLWNTLPPSIHDPSLTLFQFYALLKTALFCRAYQTLSQCIHDSLCCKHCCSNTSVFTYKLHSV